MFKPEGVYFAMLTPFKDGKIYEKTLRQMVEFDIQNGVNGLFPISTSGEFIQLDFAQKVQMMDIVMDQAKGRVPVTPGNALLLLRKHNDAAVMLSLFRHLIIFLSVRDRLLNT